MFFDHCLVESNAVVQDRSPGERFGYCRRRLARLQSRKALVIPRLIDRIIVGFSALLPERALLRLISALQRPRARS
jgi:hypothetical protein